jgi:hypothetical protein
MVDQGSLHRGGEFKLDMGECARYRKVERFESKCSDRKMKSRNRRQ